MAKKRKGWFGDSKKHSEAAKKGWQKKGALKKSRQQALQKQKYSKKIKIDSPEGLEAIAKLQGEKLRVEHIVVKLKPSEKK